jgi:hypothetical protein
LVRHERLDDLARALRAGRPGGRVERRQAGESESDTRRE